MEKEINGVRELKEKKLVGYRVVCKDGTEYAKEIPKAAIVLEQRKSEIKQLVEPVKLIGAFKAKETSEEYDGYWVCFEVHKFEDIPEEMVGLQIPSQKVAVLDFNGHRSKIFNVYTHLHEWINENGYKRLPEKWTLEIYSEWSESENKVDLCDPIE
ncbi:GyrI-like domain-containing protein [Cytobacillus sp. FJAT-54145]|uniref:GyrI-like domain-containing protein n=1 Tax=Cytobacillus spartinae TaxID=3299023 RepID=A0ABW6KB89_9BACI